MSQFLFLLLISDSSLLTESSDFTSISDFQDPCLSIWMFSFVGFCFPLSQISFSGPRLPIDITGVLCLKLLSVVIRRINWAFRWCFDWSRTPSTNRGHPTECWFCRVGGNLCILTMPRSKRNREGTFAWYFVEDKLNIQRVKRGKGSMWWERSFTQA